MKMVKSELKIIKLMRAMRGVSLRTQALREAVQRKFPPGDRGRHAPGKPPCIRALGSTMPVPSLRQSRWGPVGIVTMPPVPAHPPRRPAPSQQPRRSPAPVNESLHPRNRHQGRYDLPALVAAHPALRRFVAKNPYGDLSIDFADALAVKTLNAALLTAWHGVVAWDFPEGFLCPPIPGRADYIHHVADLLTGADGVIPRGAGVRVLDVGVGANVIYPLLGQGEYGWSFVGADINPQALAAGQQILDRNPRFAQAIRLRLQRDPLQTFHGIIQAGERFDLTICNPPFHASSADAQAGSLRKWKNLGRSADGRRGSPAGDYAAPALNFGGQAAELWCQGGEVAFIDRMIDASVAVARQCTWFTTLVAHEIHVRGLEVHLRRVAATAVRTIPMAQGQKRSRILAWTFRPGAT